MTEEPTYAVTMTGHVRHIMSRDLESVGNVPSACGRLMDSRADRVEIAASFPVCQRCERVAGGAR